MSTLLRILLLTIVLGVPVPHACGQESLPENATETAEPAQGDRIVEGRPPLYTIKRAAHPLTWLDAGVQPLVRSTQEGWIYRVTTRKPRPHLEFGVAGMGSGSGVGPRIRLHHGNFLGRGIRLEAPFLYTYKKYESYQVQASVPLRSTVSTDGPSLDLGVGYLSRAQDRFFGFGNDSDVEDETRFRTVTREAAAGLSFKVGEDWTSSVRAVYRNIGVTNPAGGISAQERFRDSSVPGLSGATLRSVEFSIASSNEERDDYAFSGGSQRFEVSFNDSPAGEAFQYWRYRFDAQRFFWLTSDGRKVLAVRGMLESNYAPAGHSVPFFDMPVLGTSQTLRGFENFRFRDKTAAALTLEYRYRIWPALDLGLFVDEGQVAPQLGDLGLGRFHTGYGARLFVWPRPNAPISIDYGRSSETWRLYISFNPRF